MDFFIYLWPVHLCLFLSIDGFLWLFMMRANLKQHFFRMKLSQCLFYLEMLFNTQPFCLLKFLIVTLQKQNRARYLTKMMNCWFFLVSCHFICPNLGIALESIVRYILLILYLQFFRTIIKAKWTNRADKHTIRKNALNLKHTCMRMKDTFWSLMKNVNTKTSIS